MDKRASLAPPAKRMPLPESKRGWRMRIIIEQNGVVAFSTLEQMFPDPKKRAEVLLMVQHLGYWNNLTERGWIWVFPLTLKRRVFFALAYALTKVMPSSWLTAMIEYSERRKAS
jgi:hypothetical protein